MPGYVSRSLIIEKGGPNQRVITEPELAALSGPIIILGEPGVGKTALTKNLEQILNAMRIPAGTLSRATNLERFAVARDTRLIIDGLDEVSVPQGVSPLDDALRKLDQLGRPRFILSCRAADWQGAVDRSRIAQDYGAPPIVIHVAPFDRDQARQFLAARVGVVDPDQLLEAIGQAGLQELSGNPLSLELLAEVSLQGEGLPNSRADLYERACQLLIRERNPAHERSAAAQAREADLLLSAGGVTALLLISGSIGVFVGNRGCEARGFAHIADFDGLPDVGLARVVLGTRLFRSDGEELFVPMHRVVAEYLGGRWLSYRLQAGLSERRLFQMFEFLGGIPTSLRGLHAWLAHFAPNVAERCIKNDPYGVLRYGEIQQLSVPRAKLLLTSLTLLAEDDPYFRSEDWGVRAVSGLARVELKDEIISVVHDAKRHFHLSSLLLEALAGSNLTPAILPELMVIVRDSAALYAEREQIVETLAIGSTEIDWTKEVSFLLQRGEPNDKRLALAIIAECEGRGVSAHLVADALVEMLGLDNDRDGDDRVLHAEFRLIKRISPAQCGEVLDCVVARIEATERASHWAPNYYLSSALQGLAARALSGGGVDERRFWCWARYFDAQHSYLTTYKDWIRKFLEANPVFRRNVQRIALADKARGDSLWMTLVRRLPLANPALYLTHDDLALFIDEIASKEIVDEEDKSQWSDLVQFAGRPEGHSSKLALAIRVSIEHHEELSRVWKELSEPRVFEWEQRERRRQEERRIELAEKHAQQRESFEACKETIEAGQDRGSLVCLALAYLNRFNDLEEEVSPVERLRLWVGVKVTEAATRGFVAVLSHADLPTIDQIVAARREGKKWTIEPVMVCGVIEHLKRGGSLTHLPDDVVGAVLAIWWDMPQLDDTEESEKIPRQIEEHVFRSPEALERFLIAVIEPAIAGEVEHISELYRVSRNQKFVSVARPLAIRWLRGYPNARLTVQRELIDICLQGGLRAELAEIVKLRLEHVHDGDQADLPWWRGLGYALAIPDCVQRLYEFATEHRDIIWVIRDLVAPRRKSDPVVQPDVSQLEQTVRVFSAIWPDVPPPRGGWSGSDNPWDATEFINRCIDSLGAQTSLQASEALTRLAENVPDRSYLDRLKHVRASQRKLRRDREHILLSVPEVREALSGGLPVSIDDLKAFILDRLDELERYLRDGDTRGWRAYWAEQTPLDENSCRDRLLDVLRPRVSLDIQLMPESLMPDLKRCDILALHRGLGLPIEIKGQWHRDVWDAAKTQLEDDYGRYWRADGRGIYLVLWFGAGSGKDIARHPDKLDPPKSSAEMKELLEARLAGGERTRISVVVLDLSKS